MNPPYTDIGTWLKRIASHGRGTALVFARTETAAFQEWVWPVASAVLFLRGRVHFHTADGRRAGPAGAPSCLIAYGQQDAEILRACGLPGAYVPLCHT